MSATSQEQGSPAGAEPDSTMRTHGAHSSAFVLQGPLGKRG